ncbi:phage portal protein [Pannus brasiliensis CCIBt3594]|uniref:Phage portal protein n=1 Tax=Pannus brasiliensis CCIBt3594 TaxID=1427578 RepID=A0AAW9QW70_9CHRO
MGKKNKKKKKSPLPVTEKRGYDAARRTRATFDWKTSSASADSELTDLPALRNRSRDLVRNNPYIKRAIYTTIPDNVVGASGIRFQSQVKRKRGDRLDDAINTQIEEAWQEWQEAAYCHTAGKLTFAGIQRLAIKSAAESGEILFRLVRRSFAGSSVSLAVEVLEADQLCETHTIGNYGDNVVKMGVEFDEWLRPVAYHCYPYHPGDTRFRSATRNARLVRIPADEVIHFFITDRPGQSRGVPWLHAAISRMRQLGEFEEAKIMQARVQGLVAATVETGDPELIGSGDLENKEGLIEDLEPGIIKYLAPGERFQGFAPTSPNDNGKEFINSLLRSAAISLGPSYEGFTGDYSQVNFSSARTAKLQEQDCYRYLQRWVIDDFLTPLYKIWLDQAVLSGRVKIDDYFQNRTFYCKPKFTPRGWSYVNPQQEAAANLLSVQAGFTTLTDIAAENGRDLEEMVKTRARELELFRQYGIPLDSTPAPVSEEPVIVGEKAWKQEMLIRQYRRNQALWNRE